MKSLLPYGNKRYIYVLRDGNYLRSLHVRPSETPTLLRFYVFNLPLLRVFFETSDAYFKVRRMYVEIINTVLKANFSKFASRCGYVLATGRASLISGKGLEKR